jgi:hypothetical protein
MRMWRCTTIIYWLFYYNWSQHFRPSCREKATGFTCSKYPRFWATRSSQSSFISSYHTASLPVSFDIKSVLKYWNHIWPSSLQPKWDHCCRCLDIFLTQEISTPVYLIGMSARFTFCICTKNSLVMPGFRPLAILRCRPKLYAPLCTQAFGAVIEFFDRFGSSYATVRRLSQTALLQELWVGFFSFGVEESESSTHVIYSNVPHTDWSRAEEGCLRLFGRWPIGL